MCVVTDDFCFTYAHVHIHILCHSQVDHAYIRQYNTLYSTGTRDAKKKYIYIYITIS